MQGRMLGCWLRDALSSRRCGPTNLVGSALRLCLRRRPALPCQQLPHPTSSPAGFHLHWQLLGRKQPFSGFSGVQGSQASGEPLGLVSPPPPSLHPAGREGSGPP